MATRQHRRTSEIGKVRRESARWKGLGTANKRGTRPGLEAQFPLAEARSIDEQPVKIPFRSR